MTTTVPSTGSVTILAQRFQLLRELGSGGYGVVYEALDIEWGARVALKTLQRMEPDALLRFKEEFRALSDVEHPNLVQLIELTCADGAWFFTMELVRGVDFYDYVRPLSREFSYLRARTLHEFRLRRALVQLLDALGAVHESGRVHCDIKPSNIRVEEGRLVLLDFGLVTGGRRFVSSDTVLGTPGYMAPEQARGEPLTPAADLYGVGVLLYEALTGTLPYAGDTDQVLRDKQHIAPPRPDALDAGLPKDLSELCVRLLEIEPEKRPTGAEVLAMLSAGEGGEGGSRERGARTSIPEPPPFVGRGAELAWLQERFAQTFGGKPVLAYISGDSGVGKSALAARFAAEQGQSATLVLRGRCYERETVPYKAFDGIVDELAMYLSSLEPEEVSALLPFDAALLIQIFPVLSRVAPIADLPVVRATQDPNVLRNHTFAALREILARLALKQPLLLVIDDLQWSDLDSLSLLQDLLLGPEAPNCMVLATGRPQEQLGPEVKEAVVELLSTSTSYELPLSGLCPDEAEQLGLAIAHDKHDREVLSRIARDTKGHPLFMAELLRHVESGHALSAASDEPLESALKARVESLDPIERALLETLAVAGAPLSLGVLMHTLGHAPTTLARRLAHLRMAHLVRSEDRERIECYHDRTRKAVLDCLDDGTRRERHRTLAFALSALEHSQEELVAYQWRCAGEAARGARYCAQAAEKAFRALAFRRAVTLYEQALAEPGEFDAEALVELRIAYARALSCAGFAARAAEAYLAAADRRAGESARALRRQATLLMLRSGRIEEGVELADRVLGEVGLSRPSTPAGAVIRLMWERARLTGSGYHYRVDARARQSGSEAEVLDLLWAVAPSLAFVDFMGGSALQSQYARLAMRSGDAQHVIRALTMEALLRSTRDAPPQDGVTRILEHVRRVANEQETPYLRALVFMSHGYVHLQSFRLTEAASQLVQAERQLRESCVDAGWELTNARIGLLGSLWNAGRLFKHAELARDWQADAKDRGDRYAATQLSCLGMGYQLALRDDDPDRCEQALAEALRGWPETFQLPHWSQYIARQLVAIYRGKGGSLPGVAAGLTTPASLPAAARVLPGLLDLCGRRLGVPRRSAAHARGRAERTPRGGREVRPETDCHTASARQRPCRPDQGAGARLIWSG